MPPVESMRIRRGLISTPVLILCAPSGPRQIIDDLEFIVRKRIAVEERRGTGAGGFDESGRARLVGSADRNGGI